MCETVDVWHAELTDERGDAISDNLYDINTSPDDLTYDDSTHMMRPKSSFGAPKSKRTGDGIWCPFCRNEGRYTWMEFLGLFKDEDTKEVREIYGYCDRHQTTIEKKRDVGRKLKEIENGN